MTSLLQIPRELRDIITVDVLTSPIAVSPDYAQISSKHVLPIVPFHRLYTGYGLLLANRQLHAEATDALKHMCPSANFRIDAVPPDECHPIDFAFRFASYCVPRRYKQLEQVNLSIHLAVEETYDANVRMLGYAVVSYGASRIYIIHSKLVQRFQQADRVPCTNINIVPSCDFLEQQRHEPVTFDDPMANCSSLWLDFNHMFDFRNLVMGALDKYETHPDRFSLMRKDMIAALIYPWFAELSHTDRVRIWVVGGANGEWEIGKQEF